MFPGASCSNNLLDGMYCFHANCQSSGVKVLREDFQLSPETGSIRDLNVNGFDDSN